MDTFLWVSSLDILTNTPLRHCDKTFEKYMDIVMEQCDGAIWTRHSDGFNSYSASHDN